MNVLFYQDMQFIPDEELSRLRQEFPDSVFQTGVDRREIRTDDADIIYGGNIPDDILRRAKRLKLVVVPYTGTNQLPLGYLRDKGIRIANTHGNARSVAERTVAMILALYGRIIDFHTDLKERHLWHGGWVGEDVSESWESLFGKTVAILGTGGIGSHTARFLRAFGTGTVTGFKRTPVPDMPDCFDRVVYSVDEAIDCGEIVVNTLPSTERTRGLINRTRLGRMSGKVFANVGRGDIAVEEDLYTALADGTLRGAVLDCWFRYPKDTKVEQPSSFPFHELPNVIFSPHIAGYSKQAVQESVSQALENIRRFLTDGSLLFEVDPDAGY
ncbi:MAG: 2-hydroxyacid dehydrogenase [Spirochaetota bacterium]